MPCQLRALCQTLQQLAPLELAESWDNVGLLVGDPEDSVWRVMTCLTITPPVVQEAIQRRCELVVVHHPLPFKPLQRITTESPTGRMLLQLIRAKSAIYSAHTAWDSAESGINQQLAGSLRLQSVRPFHPATTNGGETEQAGPTVSAVGAGRVGDLQSPADLRSLASALQRFTGASQVRCVGSAEKLCRRVGIACGSGGSFLPAAIQAGCDVLVTGEASFHSCLEAETEDCPLILLGHYASERFAMEMLAEELRRQHPQLEIWPSQAEADPLSSP